MKFLPILLFALQAACLTNPPPTSGEVYLCMGSWSYKYHLYKDCQGFNKCTTRVYSVTLKEAIKGNKRTLCSWCKKRSNK
ncbi:hypothetical protein [Ferruginibacter sp. HRS2-29]|uniref:hypothetical protein n=1 Tax=Ferruginibacter sp. HRS2-29 TaxID=2487334 RepID=UPI0020CC353A|nr:hypothetical protein [Ferruginibacter sp. HRS2-29]MCP9752348.1 hypothetical protein [Ferruginibacter sp. HRS2-29]